MKTLKETKIGKLVVRGVYQNDDNTYTWKNKNFSGKSYSLWWAMKLAGLALLFIASISCSNPTNSNYPYEVETADGQIITIESPENEPVVMVDPGWE